MYTYTCCTRVYTNEWAWSVSLYIPVLIDNYRLSLIPVYLYIYRHIHIPAAIFLYFVYEYKVNFYTHICITSRP